MATGLTLALYEHLYERPTIALQFVYPKRPALLVINQSGVVAREIKWVVVLWNLDRLPDHDDPLPIPVKTFDWLRPHTRGGPIGLWGFPGVAALAEPGSRLFGSASVICPDCKRGRTYWVFVKFGQNGWYAELQDETSGAIKIPRGVKTEQLKAALERFMLTIPESDRVPIGEWEPR